MNPLIEVARQIVEAEKRIGLKLDMVEHFEPDEHDGQEIDEANALILANAGPLASAFIESQEALEEALKLLKQVNAAIRSLEKEYVGPPDDFTFGDLAIAEVSVELDAFLSKHKDKDNG